VPLATSPMRRPQDVDHHNHGYGAAGVPITAPLCALPPHRPFRLTSGKVTEQVCSATFPDISKNHPVVKVSRPRSTRGRLAQASGAYPAQTRRKGTENRLAGKAFTSSHKKKPRDNRGS